MKTDLAICLKTKLFLICSVLMCAVATAQSKDSLRKKADSLYNVKDFRSAALAYTSLIPLNASANLDTRVYLLAAVAASWSQAENSDSAFFYLNKIADEKGLTFWHFVDFIMFKEFSSLQRDKRWALFRDRLFQTTKNTFYSLSSINNNDRLSAITAWHVYGNTDSVFHHLQLLSVSPNLRLNQYLNLMRSPFVFEWKKDSRWQSLTETIYKKAEKAFKEPLDSSYRYQEHIYGRKDGMALTMVQLQPFKSNGKALMFINSGGWRSNPFSLNQSEWIPYLHRGYSVFVVAHGSAPVYTIADAVADVQKAVQFIRYNSSEFRIDGNKIGVMGNSAGGHLALICGLADSLINQSVPSSPIDAVSAKVQAVACYYPPTDFLNWNRDGEVVFNSTLLNGNNFYKHLLEFRNWDAQRRQFEYVTDTVQLISILKTLSPINHISTGDAPVLIIHGDQDDVVPLRQSLMLIRKLEEAGVSAKLVVKSNAGHGWGRPEEEVKAFIDWFDKHLK